MKTNLERPLGRNGINEPCIYRILNLVNGHFYIGSSIRGQHRILDHMKQLRGDRHSNSYLQNAYNKYGKHNFSYDILFFCKKEDITRRELFDLEQQYIDGYKPQYNIIKKVSCPNYPSSGEKHAKEYIVKYKDESEFVIKNLKRFSRENGLNNASVSKVVKGEYAHTKDWQIRRKNETKFKHVNVRKKSWLVTDPNGRSHEILGLSTFCIQNNLIPKCMRSVAMGECSHHKGWKCEDLSVKQIPFRRKNGKAYKIIYPDGRQQLILSLQRFCEENGLNYQLMNKVSRGLRSDFNGIRCEKMDKVAVIRGDIEL